jgi:hypothetical protein
LSQLLKWQANPIENKQFVTGIAPVIDTINVQLIDRSIELHPELKNKIESDLAKYGRVT